MDGGAPDTFDGLRAMLVARHGDLSPQLQNVARFILDNPNRAALMTIADMGEEVGVPPSGFVRFSKALGYHGFSDIQRLLKGALGEAMPDSYLARLKASQGEEGQVARFNALARASLDALPEDDAVATAAGVLHRARMIHVVGMRRAFGIASYLTYTLSAFGGSVVQVTSLGAMDDTSVRLMDGQDTLVAISFPNYRRETLDIADMAHDRGCPIIAITDSAVSPLAGQASHTLLCDQPTDAGFRSGVGALVTVQALAAHFGHLRSAG